MNSFVNVVTVFMMFSDVFVFLFPFAEAKNKSRMHVVWVCVCVYSNKFHFYMYSVYVDSFENILRKAFEHY